jgi:hypothetical protein
MKKGKSNLNQELIIIGKLKVTFRKCSLKKNLAKDGFKELL